MTKPGQRVGAILSMNENQINFLGYGVYVGDEVPNNAVGFMAVGLKEYKQKNPRINLDDGSVVWGCECWWGPEDTIKKRLEAFDGWVVKCDINRVRERWKNEDSK